MPIWECWTSDLASANRLIRRHGHKISWRPLAAAPRMGPYTGSPGARKASAQSTAGQADPEGMGNNPSACDI
jgi:hypothetical protein